MKHVTRYGPIIFFALFPFLIPPAFGQDQGILKIDVGTIAKAIDSTFSEKRQHSDGAQAAYDSAYISLMHFKIGQLSRTENILAWQTTSSRIIFAMVLIIVFTGLIFSGIQFYHSSKKDFKLPASELEMSATGFKLHSSVLGLIILTISVAFFYLYLHYVYPVSFIQ